MLIQSQDEFKELARCYLCGKTWNMTLNVRWGGKQRSSKVTTTKNSRESLVRYQEVQITISEMRKCLDCSFAVCMDNLARTSSHSFIKCVCLGTKSLTLSSPLLERESKGGRKERKGKQGYFEGLEKTSGAEIL
ncbi:hypothetical protein MTR67_009857 [Solanum verrucosum]|uniref:Uncharacterized protein n=1 Tax=Solanum verrucosum TaxID=315347 RepID=A0AAF0Q508_SOLVR|nr:hypothetical protein MTR67_009857 [Solanum verrucosum]